MRSIHVLNYILKGTIGNYQNQAAAAPCSIM